MERQVAKKAMEAAVGAEAAVEQEREAQEVEEERTAETEVQCRGLHPR